MNHSINFLSQTDKVMFSHFNTKKGFVGRLVRNTSVKMTEIAHFKGTNDFEDIELEVIEKQKP